MDDTQSYDHSEQIENTRRPILPSRTFKISLMMLGLLLWVICASWMQSDWKTRTLALAVTSARRLDGIRTMDIKEAGLSSICAEYLSAKENKMSMSTLTRHLRIAISNTEPIHPTELTRQRRKLGCAMVKQGFIPGPNSKDELGRLGLVFLNKYISAAKERTGVYFHHLSKTGGSGVCFLAWLNGCRPPGDILLRPEEGYIDEVSKRAMGSNCWSSEFRDSASWEPNRPTGGVNRSCSERLKFMHDVGLNFMANEAYMGEDMWERPCSDSGLLTMVTLRHPLKRTVSHLGHMLRPNWSNHADMKDAQVCWSEGKRVANQNQLDVNFSCLADRKYIASDNYQVRMMSGRAGYVQPFGEVSNEDLESAIATLHRYDVVDVLQSERVFPFDFGTTELYRVGLGFLLIDRPARKKNQGLPLTLSNNQDIVHLSRMNANDAKLFEVGEDIVALDRAVYNRTHVYCLAMSGEVESGLSAGCEAFLSNPIQSDSHPKELLATQRNDKTPYSCGCGWAGSASVNTTFEPGMALLTRSVNKQACPRKTLFDRRGAADGIDFIEP